MDHLPARPRTMPTMSDPAPDRPLESALPPATARLLAFGAIVLAGICGGLQMEGDGGVWSGVGGLVGAVVFAGGVGVVSVLVLRAMTEWNTIRDSGDPAAARKQRRPS